MTAYMTLCHTMRCSSYIYELIETISSYIFLCIIYLHLYSVLLTDNITTGSNSNGSDQIKVEHDTHVQ